VELFSDEQLPLYSEHARREPSGANHTAASKQKAQKAKPYISSVWQFEDRQVGDRSAHFRWYGTLPLQLVSRIHDLYLPSDSTFVDLFCGTGTSLEAAMSRGTNSIGFDTNPLACQISRLRVDRRQPRERAIAAFLELSCNAKRADHLLPEFQVRYPYSSRWFNQDNLAQLLGIIEAFLRESDSLERDIALVAAASAVRNIANVNTNCTHHLVSLDKSSLPVGSRIATRIKLIAQSLSEAVVGQEQAQNMSDVRCRNATDTALPGGIADLVLLHPPYLGVINYHNIHRLSTDVLDYMLGKTGQASSDFEYERIKAADVSSDNEERYLLYMNSVFEEASRIAKRSATIVLIMADHRYKGRLRHPITELTLNLERRGWLLHERFIWLLKNNGGMHVLRKGNFIDHNYICVFRRHDPPDKTASRIRNLGN
jgi:DNA modification methylase